MQLLQVAYFPIRSADFYLLPNARSVFMQSAVPSSVPVGSQLSLAFELVGPSSARRGNRHI